MVKLLVVEDDRYKFDRISACLRQAKSNIMIKNAESVHGAIKCVREDVFDAVILDMALPSHDLRPGVGQPTSLLSGGLEIVMELGYLGRRDRIVIITQYPEIEIEGQLIGTSVAKSRLAEVSEANVSGVILYEHNSSAWEHELLSSMGWGNEGASS